MGIVSQARNALGRNKGYGGCYRCGGTWDYTPSHSTHWSDSHACFPLCEVCWTGLGTPEARLPYYRALVASWVRENPQDFEKLEADRLLIEAAVMEGL